MTAAVLQCGDRTVQLNKPLVMGILNITPDSFFDGGDFFSPTTALKQARLMVEDGVDIIDVGGESTRPGAESVSVDDELSRVIPIVEILHAELPVALSIDTSKPEVMSAAVQAGAGMINDVYALQAPGALQLAAEVDVPICLMHMQGEPRSMQHAPQYENVIAEVVDFLQQRVDVCQQAGIGRERLLIDPGFGFGKTLKHNLILMQHLPDLVALGLPVIVGVSRKSMIGSLLDAPVDERLFGSVALATLAVWQGVQIVRVHDVKATVDALRVIHAVQQVHQ